MTPKRAKVYRLDIPTDVNPAPAYQPVEPPVSGNEDYLAGTENQLILNEFSTSGLPGFENFDSILERLG